VELATGDISVLASNGAWPSWHPDGSRIAYSRPSSDDWMESFTDHDIYMLDLESGESTFLTKGTMPRWAPDGKKLAFARTDPDRVSDETSETYYGPGMGAGFDLYVLDDESGSEERVYSATLSFGMFWFGGMDPVLGWVGGSSVLLYQDVTEEDSVVHMSVHLLDTETGDSSDAPTSLLNPSWHID
jgi:Tol biopolymer transport system component